MPGCQAVSPDGREFFQRGSNCQFCQADYTEGYSRLPSLTVVGFTALRRKGRRRHFSAERTVGEAQAECPTPARRKRKLEPG